MINWGIATERGGRGFSDISIYFGTGAEKDNYQLRFNNTTPESIIKGGLVCFGANENQVFVSTDHLGKMNRLNKANAITSQKFCYKILTSMGITPKVGTIYYFNLAKTSNPNAWKLVKGSDSFEPNIEIL